MCMKQHIIHGIRLQIFKPLLNKAMFSCTLQHNVDMSIAKQVAQSCQTLAGL